MRARLVWGGLALLGGALLSVQSRMNGELAVVFGHSLDAAVWSFATGLLALSIALALSPAMRGGLRSLRTGLRERRIRWFQCIGGVVGGLFVYIQAYAVPLAGVALYTIAVVGGQTASGIIVDRYGVGPAGRVPVTPARVLAAVLAVIGVGTAVGGRVAGASAAVVVPVVLAVLAGAGMAAQQGINGRVGVVSGNPFTTTWLNFAFGMLILVVLMAPAAAVGQFGSPDSVAAPWWAWWGGLLGIVVVAVSAVAVRVLGVLLLLLLMLIGQLSTAVLLDALNPETSGHVTPLVLIGLLVTLGAAILAGAAANRAARSAPPAAWQDGRP